MDDGQLLHELAAASDEVVAMSSPPQSITLDSEEDVWLGHIPVHWKRQVQHLWHSAADALRIANAVLRDRASQPALGHLRYLQETAGLVKWLVLPSQAEQRLMNRAAEPPTGVPLVGRKRLLDQAVQRLDKGRLERGYRFALTEIEDSRAVVREAPDPPETTAASMAKLDEHAAELRRMAVEHGLIDPLGQRPDTRALLEQVLGPHGYANFAAFSQMGSHPGLTHLVFQADPKEFDESGLLVVRAHFLSGCYWAYALIAQLSAFELGDPDMSDEVYLHHQAHNPLVVESARRYRSQLLGAQYGMAGSNDLGV